MARDRQVPYDFIYMWSLKNRNKHNRNTVIHTEQKRGELGDWVKEVKELRRTNQQLQNSCGDIKHGLRDLDNAIVITMRGARRVLETSGVTL